jgi:hypothetical protein
MAGQGQGDGASGSLAGTGNKGDLAGKVEWVVFWHCLILLVLCYKTTVVSID